MKRPAETVTTRYRGFVLIVTDRQVTVLCRRGRVRLTHEQSMSSARRFIRGYVRAERNEVSTKANERPGSLTLGRSSATRAEEVPA